MKRFGRLSFRAQMLLVFVFCLVIVGSGMIFAYVFMIAELELDQRNQALTLAEEQGQIAALEISRRLERLGEVELLDLEEEAFVEIMQRFQSVLQSPLDMVAAAVLDPDGNIREIKLSSDTLPLIESDENTARHDLPESMEAFELTLRDHMPHTKPYDLEFPIGEEGYLHLRISQSPTFQTLEATGEKIRRYLWSLLLAFVGVLALGLYLMTRLSRHQVHLLGENEQLGRMAYVGTLASGLAHEIRNPLNAMSVNLAAAEEELTDGDGQSPEIIQRALSLTQKEVERLNRSVTGFMAFARPDAVRERVVELRSLVEEILELLHPLIESTGATVEIDLPEDSQLRADFSGLRQVIYNVVLNALQAMSETPDPGEQRLLRVGGRRESAQWFLWVEDSGPGIPEGAEERIFDAFHTTKAAGSGFGLSIARAVIDSHGGDIAARRVRSGGARIEITLPETLQKEPPYRNTS